MALINYLTQIQFAEGAVGLLAQELAALGIERPLVVTDKGCLLYTSPSPRDKRQSRMPSSA